MTSVLPAAEPLQTGVGARWLDALAYRNQATEWSLYGMFLTGLPLWDVFGLEWAVERWFLLSHLLLSALFFVLFVVPFWIAHRRLLARSRKRLLVVTGRMLELILLTCGASGFYLMWFGNTGNLAGALVSLLHLITGLLMMPVLMRHAARWSVLKPAWRWLRLVEAD
jgi:hypothetical protein